MGEPTPFAPHFEELNEPCPDCGSAPITGQFSYLGKSQDPVEFRKRLIATQAADVRIFGDVLCSFVDWECSKAKCRKAKTYDESPTVRLAKRTRP